MFAKFIVGENICAILGAVTCFSPKGKCLNTALKSRRDPEGARPMT